MKPNNRFYFLSVQSVDETLFSSRTGSDNFLNLVFNPPKYLRKGASTWELCVWFDDLRSPTLIFRAVELRLSCQLERLQRPGLELGQCRPRLARPRSLCLLEFHRVFYPRAVKLLLQSNRIHHKYSGGVLKMMYTFKIRLNIPRLVSIPELYKYVSTWEVMFRSRHSTGYCIVVIDDVNSLRWYS